MDTSKPHWPLSRTMLCLDCGHVFEMTSGACPGCASKSTETLATFLDRARPDETPCEVLSEWLICLERGWLKMCDRDLENHMVRSTKRALERGAAEPGRTGTPRVGEEIGTTDTRLGTPSLPYVPRPGCV